MDERRQHCTVYVMNEERVRMPKLFDHLIADGFELQMPASNSHNENVFHKYQKGDEVVYVIFSDTRKYQEATQTTIGATEFIDKIETEVEMECARSRGE